VFEIQSKVLKFVTSAITLILISILKT